MRKATLNKETVVKYEKMLNEVAKYSKNHRILFNPLWISSKGIELQIGDLYLNLPIEANIEGILRISLNEFLKFLKIIKKKKGQEIEIELINKKVSLRCSNRNLKIDSIDIDSYIQYTELSYSNKINFQVEDLISSIPKVNKVLSYQKKADEPHMFICPKTKAIYGICEHTMYFKSIVIDGDCEGNVIGIHSEFLKILYEYLNLVQDKNISINIGDSKIMINNDLEIPYYTGIPQGIYDIMSDYVPKLKDYVELEFKEFLEFLKDCQIIFGKEGEIILYLGNPCKFIGRDSLEDKKLETIITPNNSSDGKKFGVFYIARLEDLIKSLKNGSSFKIYYGSKSDSPMIMINNSTGDSFITMGLNISYDEV